jgi:anti-sigma B factor antagonist
VTNHDPRSGTVSLIVPTLDVHVSGDGDRQVINVSGELDVRTRHYVEQACLAGDDPVVVLEMSGLTFMDCCGYAGLVAVRRVLQQRGGSLTLSHQAGQPARLLILLESTDAVGADELNVAVAT